MNEKAPLLRRFPELRDHYLAGGGCSADIAAAELERFFELTETTSMPLAMISPSVDLMWHKFIEFTESYTGYCLENFGRVVHHRPRTSHSPVPDEAVRNTVDCYVSRFGPMPPIWTDEVPDEVIAYAERRSDALPPAYRWSGWPGQLSAPR